MQLFAAMSVLDGARFKRSASQHRPAATRTTSMPSGTHSRCDIACVQPCSSGDARKHVATVSQIVAAVPSQHRLPQRHASGSMYRRLAAASGAYTFGPVLASDWGRQSLAANAALKHTAHAQYTRLLPTTAQADAAHTTWLPATGTSSFEL